MEEAFEDLFRLDDLVPGLRQEVEKAGLDPKRVILVAIPVKDPEQHPTPVPFGGDRALVHLSDGKQYCEWKSDSLRALFRGDKKPPVLGDYPEAYNDAFLLLDLHALEISRIFGDRRDAEMREIYAALRRRPDGRSLGFVHDYMWQAAAWVLGSRPLSQAEFEAIMSRLERSCRTFEIGPGSRNYVTTLRRTLGRESDR